jgi:MFS family permease
MEFSASMLWTASSVLMVERYATNEKKAAAGITNLSLASTSGTILAKVIGGALLSQYHWRQVCLLSFFVAAAGSGLLYFVRKENVKDPDLEINGAIALAPNSKLQSSPKPKLTFKSIRTTLSRVLGDKMFFVIGFAHFGSFIVRSSDKIIGAFLADSTELPSKYLPHLTDGMVFMICRI